MKCDNCKFRFDHLQGNCLTYKECGAWTAVMIVDDFSEKDECFEILGRFKEPMFGDIEYAVTPRKPEQV